MIRIEVNKEVLKDIEEKLGSLSMKASDVLKKSVNQVAKEARKKLASEAQKTYTVKKTRFNREMKIKNATKSTLCATIMAEGRPLPLADFRTKSNTPTDAAKAKVLKTSMLKSLTLSGASDSGTDLKAFIATVGSHTGIFQRLTPEARAKQQSYYDGRHYKNGKRTSKKNAIKELKSSSVPSMIGDEERVYGKVKMVVQNDLLIAIEKNIDEVLGRSQ